MDELKSYGLTVSMDEFLANTPVGEKKMVNITAELPGDSKDVIIIATPLRHQAIQRYEVCWSE